MSKARAPARRRRIMLADVAGPILTFNGFVNQICEKAEGIVESGEEEMEKEGIDATEKDEIKKYLIKKYNIDIENNN